MNAKTPLIRRPALDVLNPLEVLHVESVGGVADDYETLELDVPIVGLSVQNGSIVLHMVMPIPEQIVKVAGLKLAPTQDAATELIVKALGLAPDGQVMNARIRLPILRKAITQPKKSLIDDLGLASANTGAHFGKD